MLTHTGNRSLVIDQGVVCGEMCYSQMTLQPSSSIYLSYHSDRKSLMIEVEMAGVAESFVDSYVLSYHLEQAEARGG